MQPENAIQPFDSSAPTRRVRILDAAARAFAAHGYRGSSLRDIARDAGCSLTLLDHHFGGKGLLLEAVVKGQHEHCHTRLAGLKASLAPASAFVFEDFVAAWANYEFDLYDTREGRQYFALMMRLADDGDVADDVRRGLNCSEVLVVQAFTRARPALAEDVLRGGWFVASAALYAAVTRGSNLSDFGDAGTPAAARTRTIAFLVDGLHGYWRDAPSPADSRR